jgi:undecaprenyl-diphosphatase
MDDRIFTWANHVADRTPWLHGIATTYAVYGIGLFAVLLLLAWWDARRAPDPAGAVAAVGWAGVAPLLGAIAVQLIGAPINRARPTAVIDGTHLLLARTTDFSFPSDHGTATAAVAFGLLVAGTRLRHRWYGPVAIALAVLMGLDRVYVGAHYPTDVIAGFVLGGLIALGLARPATHLLTKVTTALADSPVRALIERSAERKGRP